jgi:hypothetical protein
MGGVVGGGGVVVGLAPPQVPAPGVLVAPHQALVPGCMKNSFSFYYDQLNNCSALDNKYSGPHMASTVWSLPVSTV